MFLRISDVFTALDTWRVYSVNGWPCRRGTTCRQNKHAGFWFCELEGGDENSWDYCCRPDHQCGYSEGFPYHWCYVGPERSQWRKCSDRYYPYFDHLPHQSHSKYYLSDRFSPTGQSSNYIPDLQPPFRPGARPDRPPAPPKVLPPGPSLNEYEAQFDKEFLEPPKPGGFGPPKHWPVSYLHKYMPPNVTATSQNKTARMQMPPSPKFAAIQNLIEIIKSNDLKNIKYQITNDSNQKEDALFVKIPLPTNFTQETMTEKAQKLDNGFSVLLPVDDKQKMNSTKQSNGISKVKFNETSVSILTNQSKNAALYRRSYVERTNITTHGRQARMRRDLFT